MPSPADHAYASLAGSAIGDALGLPYENLSARRAARLLGEPDRFRFAMGRGMVSDDAEHACMTAAAFANSGGDVDRFRRDLGRRLRWWLLTIPCGIGLATLKSIGKLWLGASPARSGVWSAGNGPAMRAAILGRLCAPDELFAFVEASSQITHRDPRATLGAFAIAMSSLRFSDRACADAERDVTQDDEARAQDLAQDPAETLHAGSERTRAEPALAAPEPGRREYGLPRRVGATGALHVRATIDAITRLIPPAYVATDLIALLDRVAISIDRGESTEAFADSICRKRGRVSGFIYETVPVALHAAFAHVDAMEAVRAAIRCGGDSDSVASIVGGLRGVDDPAMLARRIEWPCDATWLRRLADAATSRSSPPRLPWLSRIARNALQLAIVLLHVARRALPPY